MLGGNKFWSVTCSGVANKFTGVEEVKNQRLLDDLFRETSKFLTTWIEISATVPEVKLNEEKTRLFIEDSD